MNEILRMFKRPNGSVLVEFYVKPIGYVRQNWNSRYRSDRLGERINAYNSYKATLRDLLSIAMKQQGIEKFPKVPLWIKADFYFASPVELLGVDIDNAIKGILDSCNRILIPDDRWIISAECRKRYDGPEKVIFAIGEL